MFSGKYTVITEILHVLRMELTGRGAGGARGPGLPVTTRWHYEQCDSHEKAKPP